MYILNLKRFNRNNFLMVGSVLNILEKLGLFKLGIQNI